MPFLRPDKQAELPLTISVRTFFKVLLLIVVTIALLAALQKVAYSITLILIAFFLALALHAPVSFIARHLPGFLKDSRIFATSLSFLIVIAILAAILISIVPPIVHQTQSFVSTAPKLVQDLRGKHSGLAHLIEKYNLQSQVDSFSQQLVNKLENSSGVAVATLTSVGASIVAVLTVLALTFMMITEAPHWMNVSNRLLPEKHQDHVDKLIRKMYIAVKGYVNGQVLLAALAALVVLPGLLIFHISYPVALMAVIFICALIPVIGHTIAMIIVTIVALFHSPFSAIGILVYYLLYQQIEAYLIQPRLQANTTNLSPLLVFIALVVGINFDGLIGGLVAIPVMACLRVGAIDYLESKHLMKEDKPKLGVKG